MSSEQSFLTALEAGRGKLRHQPLTVWGRAHFRVTEPPHLWTEWDRQHSLGPLYRDGGFIPKDSHISHRITSAKPHPPMPSQGS